MDLAIIPSAQVDATVLRSSLDGIISIDAHGLVLEFNPAAERMFGCTRDEVIGQDMAELIVPPADRARHRAGLARLLRGGESRILDTRVELEAMRADGTTFPVEIAITRMSGSRATYTGFIRDITDHKLVEQQRAERIARQALVVALGQSALAGLEPAGVCASGLATLLEGLGAERGSALTIGADGGLRRESAIGLGALAGHGEPAGETQVAMLRRTIDAGGSLLLTGSEVAAVAGDGLLVAQGMACLLTVTLQGDRGATIGMLAVASADAGAVGPEDVGFAQSIANVIGTAIARWRADEEITRLGLQDPLTGLANRPLFENRLQQALDRARREQGDAAVLFVDVDGFGRLNDGFGYRTGDEVLVGVGARLVGVLPAEATAGRLAGDDFAVLVPGVASDAEALELAERIGAALSEPMLAGGRELSLTASIGVVLTEHGAGTVADILRTATAAAARARERGGARAELATQGMRRRLLHAAEIEQGLRRTLTDAAASLPGALEIAAAAPAATLSLGQVAQALRISTTTARRWADDGRLGATRTAGGHRRFAASEVRRLLAERGRPQVAPAISPRRALPGLADLVEEHGVALAELSWRGLYGELRAGFFLDADGRAAAERWIGALSSAAATANYEMLHKATSALMRAAEQGGASLLERHLALERLCETASRALARRACPREEIVAVRQLFASLEQRLLAAAD